MNDMKCVCIYIYRERERESNMKYVYMKCIEMLGGKINRNGNGEPVYVAKFCFEKKMSPRSAAPCPQG